MVEFLSRDYIVHRMITPPSFNEGKPDYPAEPVLTKPKFSIRKERNRGMILNFGDQHTHTIRIYGKRGSEENFSILSEIKESYYIDERRNLFEAPEIREYKAVYIEEGKEIGQISDVVLIINK